jgi:hypothetical protein
MPKKSKQQLSKKQLSKDKDVTLDSFVDNTNIEEQIEQPTLSDMDVLNNNNNKLIHLIEDIYTKMDLLQRLYMTAKTQSI